MRMRCGGEVLAGRREGVERWHCERHARGRSDSRLGGQGTRGAHLEHFAHGRDLGGVKAHRDGFILFTTIPVRGDDAVL